MIENKELAAKIIKYLKELEEGEISSKINNKKRNILLSKKNEYEKLEKDQLDYQELSKLVELEEQDSIIAEIKAIEEKKDNLINAVKDQLITEEGVKQNIVVEIRPGTGGTEAGLFAHDLYRMYYRFSDSKG